uniref:Uncharacterized protein n=1 Tax=Timema monikensis TaxID=170555 RepID=A0A7R9ED69_9NEOP|nr:unnamed protein product [Timema monikensis]
MLVASVSNKISTLTIISLVIVNTDLTNMIREARLNIRLTDNDHYFGFYNVLLELASPLKRS